MAAIRPKGRPGNTVCWQYIYAGGYEEMRKVEKSFGPGCIIFFMLYIFLYQSLYSPFFRGRKSYINRVDKRYGGKC